MTTSDSPQVRKVLPGESPLAFDWRGEGYTVECVEPQRWGVTGPGGKRIGEIVETSPRMFDVHTRTTVQTLHNSGWLSALHLVLKIDAQDF